MGRPGTLNPQPPWWVGSSGRPLMAAGPIVLDAVASDTTLGRPAVAWAVVSPAGSALPREPRPRNSRLRAGWRQELEIEPTIRVWR